MRFGFYRYLWDVLGGETVLLHRMEDSKEAVRVAVEPRRGRLLLFPHLHPHLARPIESPKLLLRGEILLPTGSERAIRRRFGLQTPRFAGYPPYAMPYAASHYPPQYAAMMPPHMYLGPEVTPVYIMIDTCSRIAFTCFIILDDVM